MVISAVVLLAVYVVIAVVVLGCANGRIGPNSVAGIRTPTIMANETTWQAGHQAARLPMLAGTAAGAVCAVAVFLVETETLQNLLTGISVALMLLGLVFGAVAGTRAARAVMAGSPTP